MQTFKYTAVNLQNQKIKGIFIAKDEEDLAAQLARQDLFLLSSGPYAGESPITFWTLSGSRVSMQELASFSRQFAIMLSSHVPLLECLDILKNQPFTICLRRILSAVYEDVKGGLLLSGALSKHAKIFPDFFRSMVYVGEMSGKLDTVLQALADYYERDVAMRQKFSSAMAYPAMLFCMLIAIVILMLAVIVPTFQEALAELEVPIVGITRVVYSISDFLLQWWHFMLLGVIVLSLLVFGCLQTRWGKYAFDVCKVKLPLIKQMQMHMLTARFARAFALLLSSGMDLTDAMDAASVVLTNRYMKKHFLKAVDYVRQGMSLTNAMHTVAIFPEMLTRMIAIGERTNALDDVLMRSCTFFDTRLEASFASFTAKIQPAMMLILGIVVGGMFLAVYAPMLSIMNTL